MNFKKPKEQVARDAGMRAYSIIQYNLTTHNNGNISGIGDSVSIAIRMGIEEAIRSMLEDVYTDVEFEEDLQLRGKN